MNYKQTEEAKLIWEEGRPRSSVYDDPYFSNVGGLAETEYVFIKHNELPQRWLKRENFVIAETGFGIGLNFLATCRHWLQTTSAPQSLTFISVEKHPLSKADLKKSLALWNDLASLSSELIENYPINISGFHRIELFDKRVCLLLLIGDASEMFQKLRAEIDAWFLDGFAPSKNQSMWSRALYQQVARLSRAGTTFSTYTVAGDVRRGLQSVGFDVKKSKGFGDKREMIHGVMSKDSCSSISKPWFSTSAIEKNREKEVCVIGAGIAGLTTAYVFAENGWKVTVVEKKSGVAGGASGNPVGLIMPRLTSDMNRGARFYTESFFNAIRWLDKLKQREGFDGWWKSGVLHLMPEEKLAKLHALNFPNDFISELTVEEIKFRYNMECRHGGYLIHQAGYVAPKELCRFLYELLKDRVRFQFSTEIDTLCRHDNKWRLQSENEESFFSENVVIASASDAERFFSADEINIAPVRGQLSYIPNEQLSVHPDIPIVCENYLTPVVKNKAVLGASYHRESIATELFEKEHDEIVSQFNDVVPKFLKNEKFLDGRASIRCTTYDRLPIVGPVPDWDCYKKAYADIKHGKPLNRYANGIYQPGLYINVAHGSRGFVSSINCAELLYSMKMNKPLFFENEIIESIHPARFLIKKLKRS